MNMRWPHGRDFAFTIFDDTDWATTDSVKPLYDLMAELGMRTTKSTWMTGDCTRPTNAGMTCNDRSYADWLLELQERGFEIALHNVAPGTSPRDVTRRELDCFQQLFGSEQIVHCNHVGCLDNIYWGSARLTGWRTSLYNLLTRGRKRDISRGHKEGDPLFWGDLCRDQIRYVRNFIFDDINTLSACPEMPYHDPSKPFVNYWFASSDAGTLERFLNCFTTDNIDRLVDQVGLCIAYVHFGRDFVIDGRVIPEVDQRLRYIASKNGWFAPVSQILDYLRNGQSSKERTINPARLRYLEMRWLLGKVFKGTS